MMLRPPARTQGQAASHAAAVVHSLLARVAFSSNVQAFHAGGNWRASRGRPRSGSPMAGRGRRQAVGCGVTCCFVTNSRRMRLGLELGPQTAAGHGRQSAQRIFGCKHHQNRGEKGEGPHKAIGNGRHDENAEFLEEHDGAAAQENACSERGHCACNNADAVLSKC